MSLKIECVDMIKLLVNAGEWEQDYDLEMDSYRDICTLSGEDITYSECSGCEHSKCGEMCGKSIDCPYMEHIKVDVNFCVYGELEKNYIFSRKQNKSVKGVTYISNRKQLMQEMIEMKNRHDSFKRYFANFGYLYSDFLDYAKEFVGQLKKDFSFFSGLDETVLPIILHLDSAKDKDNKYIYNRGGDVIYVGKQVVINCYCCTDDVEKTKCNLRHELLHYALYIAGMKHDDDVAVFHYLCERYEADAWKEMTEEEQKLYDDLKRIIRCRERYEAESTDKKSELEKGRNHLIEVVLMAIGEYRGVPKVYESSMRVFDKLSEQAKKDEENHAIQILLQPYTENQNSGVNPACNF